MNKTNIDAYPLCWPDGWPRTERYHRETSRFGDRSRAAAINHLLREISLLGGTDVVISSNLKLRGDGLPYSTQPKTDDPGVAVYFQRKGSQMCFACDTFFRDVENLWAIKLTVEALRGISRWGASDMMDRAFTGFAALPDPNDWCDTLGIDREATLADAEAAYRTLAVRHHPDRPGGDAQQMAKINGAIATAREVLA